MPRPPQLVQQRAGARIGRSVPEIECDAAVHGAEADAVAVALQQLAQAVADREVERRTGAEAVGDGRREGHVAGGQVADRARGDVDRHPHRLAAGPAPGRHPFQRGVVIDRAAGRQAQRQRIGDMPRADLAAQRGVACRPALHAVDLDRGVHGFGQLAGGADDGRGVVHAVADAVRRHAMPARAVVVEEDGVPAGHAGAVQRAESEQLDPAFRHRVRHRPPRRPAGRAGGRAGSWMAS